MPSVVVMPVTFTLILCMGSALSAQSSPDVGILSPVNNPAAASKDSLALRWFFRKMGKRASGLNKCGQHAACAMLQLQPGSTSYWTDEICSCGDDMPVCSLEWDEQNLDGKSVINADTQLKLCQPQNTMPTCTAEQTAVTSTMETSMAHPAIKQTASVFCHCPKPKFEFKLADAGMDDTGDRTIVSAHFGCISVEHCRTLQPCKFLAILPTGDSLVHQNCECNANKKCPQDSSPNGIIPAIMDEITYYPFFCQ